MYNILTADTSQQRICLDKIRYDFGTVQTAASVTFTVRNTGLSDLTVSSITSDSNAFTINENCTGTVISTGNTCSFQVDFIPTQSTTYSGIIIVYYGNGQSVNISVSGTTNLNSSDNSGGRCSYGQNNISNFAVLLTLVGIFLLRKLKFS
ncbi:DUF1573 domain-containing protein [Persephonella atlantica]|uniref:DUF1573 domain-containing protein n=1 Tax=Persephonella atlantica TaxID=2699429 RepID=A0ABS1GFE7_9AQUI|nr:DUF1573 domain-containing protein [Persephonella atlantica]MBK3331497.1 DUF1573 domain-containing protein [Persephonella atlantica]